MFSKRTKRKIRQRPCTGYCKQRPLFLPRAEYLEKAGPRLAGNFHPVHIQLFRERLSGKVHATILKGIVGGFEFSVFQRNLKQLARKAMEMCLRVLKESNKSMFDSYSCQEQCIDHIPYYLSGLSRAHFSDNLSRNSCICVCRSLLVGT